jgi:hypothetical protein
MRPYASDLRCHPACPPCGSGARPCEHPSWCSAAPRPGISMLARQYLCFCTSNASKLRSKASKLRTSVPASPWRSPSACSSVLPTSAFCVSICTCVLGKALESRFLGLLQEPAHVSCLPATSHAYVSIRHTHMHTSAYVSIRSSVLPSSAFCVSICTCVLATRGN